MTPYPDLNQYPSVLETAQIEDILSQILRQFEKEPLSLDAIAELMVDTLLARAYRPTEKYDRVLSLKLVDWVKDNWQKGNIKFADAALTVLANIDCMERDVCLYELLEVENRPLIRQEILATLRELKIKPQVD